MNVVQRCVRRLVLVAGCLAIVVLSVPMAPSRADAQSPRMSLPGHVLPALAQARVAADAATFAKAAALAAEPIALTVVLRRSDPAGFETYLEDVYNPASPGFRQFLSPMQVTERFGPSAQDYQAVRDYFDSQGLAPAEDSANRMTLIVRGTRDDVRAALAVNVKDYTLGERSFFANDSDPMLPADIAGRVEAVVGLANLAVPRPNSQAVKVVFCTIVANVQAVEPFTDKSGKVWAPSSQALKDKIYKDCMIDRVADGYGGLKKVDPPPPAWQGADGTGQKVGVVAFDTLVMSDISDFIHLAGLPAGTLANVTNVHVNGGASAGASQDEVLLDVDTIIGIAPGTKVIVYDGPFNGPNTSFQAIVNAMVNGGVDIISNSWAYCEDQTTLADVQSIDTILQTAAASGISAFTGSGDHGSACLDGHANTVHVPASSPHITAVGGTSLTMNPGHTYGSETWWDSSASTPPGGQGGFGTSVFFNRPAYQDGLSVSPMRSVPDVASNADPAKGVQICQASAGGCPSGLYYGGTSKSAPSWAAFAAMLNQAQGSNLGFLNSALYPLANTSAFHPAAGMGSDFSHVGLGSPNLAKLHQQLTAQTAGPVDPAVSQVAAFMEMDAFAAPNVLGLSLPGLADGSTRSFVVVRLADVHGNIVAGKTVTLSAGAGSAVITPASGVSDGNNGAVVFTVTNLVQETLTFTATDTTDAVVLGDQPDIQFLVPAAASAGISASPTSVPPDQVTTTTITVTLKDALNRPTPGKTIAISQGAGHSIIAAPTPSVTDANGQVAFTATNGVSEVVTYTAIVVTDGDVPVPGSATVDFTGTSTSCVGAAPVAGPGFAVTPWATGFLAQPFNFANVNWGGCPGASNPAFNPSGGAFVADFRTGDLFQFDVSGGASAGKKLSNLAPTLRKPTYGKDGRLYAGHGATTNNFTTGDIVEIDPVTGAQVRVLAANLTCPNGVAIDPLSGDIFFVDECFGAGSDNPSLWRIHDPGGAATLSVYATLPRTPNGEVSFAPDGTIYVQTGYNDVVKQIVAVSGTDKPSPPVIATVPDLTSFYAVSVAQALPNGAAKSLLVSDSTHLSLVDITTTPYTTTLLVSGTGVGAGSIGPDGCMYVGVSDTVYKLTASDGTCGFVPTNPAPALSLSPASISPNPAQGNSLTFTATFANISAPAGTPVSFNIGGANPQNKLATTNAGGAATISYVGAIAGTDTITATASVGATALTSNTAKVTWMAGKHASFVGLDLAPSSGAAGAPVTLQASLADVSVMPTVAIAGVTIHFTLGGQSCNGTTNASGVASCDVTPPAGHLTLSASFAGNAQYTPSTASQAFIIASADGATAPGAPTGVSAVAGNGTISVTFAAPGNDGGRPITSYIATCTPVPSGPGITGAGTASPIFVFGVTNGVTYTCTVSAVNAIGPGVPSAPSNGATPDGPAVAAHPIPVLGGAGAIALAMMLAGLALATLRRRGHAG